jgi:uncharacterized protein (TIGR02452 family)
MLQQFVARNAAEDSSAGAKRGHAIGLQAGGSPGSPERSHDKAATSNSEYGSFSVKAVVDGVAKAGDMIAQAAGDALKAIGGGYTFGKERSSVKGGAAAAATSSGISSYDDERSERARVWAQTHTLTMQGSYTNRSGQHQVLQYKTGRPFKFPNSAAAAPSKPGCRTRIVVENKDCLHAAGERARSGLRTCVLDAGSGGHFGGGYRRGASAQEEDICRRSCLADMVDHDLHRSLPQLYPLHASCVMVPRVPVFRDDRHAHEPYALLDSPFVVDVGIVAAVNRPALKAVATTKGTELRLTSADASHTRACIHNFFAAAQQVGAQVLVLVPLGCGAFCNPPGHVCDIFLEVIDEFKGVFQVRFCARGMHTDTGASRVLLLRFCLFVVAFWFILLNRRSCLRFWMTKTRAKSTILKETSHPSSRASSDTTRLQSCSKQLQCELWDMMARVIGPIKMTRLLEWPRVTVVRSRRRFVR